MSFSIVFYIPYSALVLTSLSIIHLNMLIRRAPRLSMSVGRGWEWACAHPWAVHKLRDPPPYPKLVILT